MNTVRDELLHLLAELAEEMPELRMGQMVVNLATLAHGPQAEAVWDADDEALVIAAKRLLDQCRKRNADVA